MDVTNSDIDYTPGIFCLIVPFGFACLVNLISNSKRVKRFYTYFASSRLKTPLNAQWNKIGSLPVHMVSTKL